MRKYQKPSPTRSSLRPILIFCTVVFSVIVLSLSFKLFVLVRQSKVDRAHIFSVSFIYKNDVDIVIISSDQKEISHLKILGKGSAADKVLASGILPDESIALQKTFTSPRKISSYFLKAVMHREGVKSSLSVYDLLRLTLRVQGVPASSVTSESLSTPTDENSIDALVSKMLVDQSLVRDNKTISIINATGVSGLGTKIGRIFTNMGLSVISVTNGEKTQDTSELRYFGDKSYTTSRLSSLLAIVLKTETQQRLSDIIFTIGKDKSTIFQ